MPLGCQFQPSAGFACEEEFEEVIGALDAINFGILPLAVVCFLPRGVGTGREDDGDADIGVSMLVAVSLKARFLEMTVL